jgi:NAD(P)H-nitrite reductase large subunit
LDKETAFPMQKHLTELGIKLHLKESITKIAKTETGKLSLQMKSGGSLNAHAVIIAIDVKPASELAAQAGLAIGGSGGIVVDESIRTRVTF